MVEEEYGDDRDQAAVHATPQVPGPEHLPGQPATDHRQDTQLHETHSSTVAQAESAQGMVDSNDRIGVLISKGIIIDVARPGILRDPLGRGLEILDWVRRGTRDQTEE